MNRIIFCAFLQREAEGLDFQPYPDKIGKRIFDQISKEAWGRWIERQTMLINEKRLNLIKFKDKKFLEQEMVKFLFKN